MNEVHIYNRATGQHAHVAAKSVGTWADRGWEAYDALQEHAEQESAAEADKTSRGKSSARTQKDK